MINFIKNILLLSVNYLYDFATFAIYSGSFSTNTEKKVLSKLIFNYHSIEKGLINEDIRYRFGQQKVKRMLYLIEIWNTRAYDLKNSQFIAANSVLLKYYELHRENNINIDDIISEKDYHFILKNARIEEGGTLNFKAKHYFSKINDNFEIFSNSRHSIRHFNGEKVSYATIEKVINIARNAPSVCNRQSSNVYFIDNEEMTKQVLKVQSGMNATADTVKQVLIVTSSLASFVSPVERNQMFVDGGIFLQNLLYSLHYYGIAACTLNWSKPFFYETNIRKHIDVGHKERIIAVIAIGYPKENFKVPYSKRKDVKEILQHIKN